MSNTTATETKPVTHFLSIKDCSRDQLNRMIDRAAAGMAGLVTEQRTARA